MSLSARLNALIILPGGLQCFLGPRLQITFQPPSRLKYKHKAMRHLNTYYAGSPTGIFSAYKQCSFVAQSTSVSAPSKVSLKTAFPGPNPHCLKSKVLPSRISRAEESVFWTQPEDAKGFQSVVANPKAGLASPHWSQLVAFVLFYVISKWSSQEFCSAPAVLLEHHSPFCRSKQNRKWNSIYVRILSGSIWHPLHFTATSGGTLWPVSHTLKTEEREEIHYWCSNIQSTEMHNGLCLAPSEQKSQQDNLAFFSAHTFLLSFFLLSQILHSFSF